MHKIQYYIKIRYEIATSLSTKGDGSIQSPQDIDEPSKTLIDTILHYINSIGGNPTVQTLFIGGVLFTLGLVEPYGLATGAFALAFCKKTGISPKEIKDIVKNMNKNKG